MKRVVSSSIVSVLILLMIAGAFFYFQFSKNDRSSVFELVPADVAWMVSVDPGSGDLQRLARSSFFSGCDSIDVMKDWHLSLLFFDSLCVNNAGLKEIFNESPLVISGHVTGPSSFSLMFFSRLDARQALLSDEIIRLVFRSEAVVQSRNYNGIEIKELKTGANTRFAWTISKGIFIGSSTPYLVEDAIRQQKNSTAVSPAASIRTFIEEQPDKMIVAIQYSGFSRWLKTQFRDPAAINLLPLERLGDWSVMNLDLHSSMIAFNGQTLARDSVSFVQLFEGQNPVERKLADWLPAKTAATVIWGASDTKVLLETLRKQHRKEKVDYAGGELIPYFEGWIGNEIALIVTQPAASLSDNNFMAMLSVRDSARCQQSLEALGGSVKEELYNGYSIRYIDRKWILKDLFGSLFNRVSRFYYTRINHHIVIANQASVVRAYINDIKTSNLLVKEDRYKSLATHVPEKGNIFFYCSIPQSEKVFASIAAPAWVTWLASYGSTLKNWNGITFSISNNQGLFSTTGCIGYFNKAFSGPQLAWNVKMDTTLACGPFMPAGINGLILAQDVSNQLYAYDNTGSLKWKKNLETSLLGDISKVDLYKNGSSQYIFNTHSFVYIVDSTGQDVGSYPFRLPAEASAGLTYLSGVNGVEDRFYLPCKNLRMYAYHVSGKPLPGFSPVKLPGLLAHPVYVNRALGKLILMDENGTAFVTAFNGERLFTLKGQVYTERDRDVLPGSDAEGDLLAFRGKDGVLYRVGKDGEIEKIFSRMSDSVYSSAAVDLNGDQREDWLLSTTNGLFFKTNDDVTLFRFTSEGKISEVRSHVLKNKVYVSALGNNRVFLFNRDGTVQEGFPVPGTGVPEMAEGSAGERFLLLQGGPDNISLYQLM
ncbi:MAG: DUF3352 domain-containing protein [Bacteroidia bacterium]|nr:DUF3352 domain-containing protein [Bacteroidia bacterium]